MTDKVFYGISGIYRCPRVLSAERLGHEPTPKQKSDEDRLEYYTMLEAVVAKKVENLGYELINGGKCLYCEEKYKHVRHGIHCEVDKLMYEIVGHMDRLLYHNGRQFPLEIKTAGKSAFNKFAEKRFKGNLVYAGQECCYLKSAKSPGAYVMMERDSGQLLKFVVNDFNNELNLPDFEKIELPITFDDVIDRLNSVEIDVADGKLSDAVESEDCFWCSYKHLCVKEEEKKAVIVDEDFLLEASKEYIKGLNAEKKAKELKSASAAILLNYAKTNNLDKFRTPKLSFSYRGLKSRKWLDEATVRKMASPDVIRMAERESEPYDDYTAKEVKKKDMDKGE